MQRLTIDDVPRDKLRDLLNRMCKDQVSLGVYGDELRALVDLPVAPAIEPAAPPQGEPVAWLNVATGHVTTSAVVVMDWDDEKEQVQSLYAVQPAPVAVGAVKMHGDMKCIAFGDEEWKALNVGDIIFTTGARV